MRGRAILQHAVVVGNLALLISHFLIVLENAAHMLAFKHYALGGFDSVRHRLGGRRSCFSRYLGLDLRLFGRLCLGLFLRF